uniref:FAD-dependent monooxygenase DEP2 ) n=1 Tax=Ganoderma boninense TaxID=34458 RepID=A0A5K1JWB6_9APHY|nr:FAD-dependent monooxygenase DEP2 (EC (Depudecin biosynthesis cluster protein 2) [Ganoderma boninense]
MSSLPLPNNFVDVLIIGAGPAGLMCANALAHAGVKVRIVDQKVMGWLSVSSAKVHALIGQHSTTLVQKEGYAHADTAQLTRHQAGIESLFHDSMATKGLVVQRPVVPTSIELSDVASDLENPNAYPVKIPQTPSAKSCTPSAHSWVRKAFDIVMDGDQTDSIWGVVDIVPETDFPDLRSWSFVHSHSGTLMNIPREGDMVRFYIQLPDDTDFVNRATRRVDMAKASPARIMECAAKILRPFRVKQVGEPEWWTVYIIGQRVAKSYSVRDRVFIAGDACHTHSPKAGQGMNASMNDTHNLGMAPPQSLPSFLILIMANHDGGVRRWKLAYVLRGWAGMSLLKTYESERLKYAQDLINFDKKWSKLFRDKPQTEGNADGVSHEEFLGMLATSNGFMSGIGIHYEPSVIVDPRHQSCASKVVVGERMIPHDFIGAANAVPVNIHDMLPSDTRFKILVFTGDIGVEGTMSRVCALAERMDAPAGFLKRFGKGAYRDMFDVLCICATKQDKMDFTGKRPELFRSHWSKVLLDDKDMFGRGGGGYEAYGIDAAEGAIVVVRPDGFVGTVAPFEHLDDITRYFAMFLLDCSSVSEGPRKLVCKL